VARDKTRGFTLFIGSTSPSNPMNEVVDLSGHVEVEYVSNSFDVNPSPYHIGRDEDPNIARFKIFERLFPILLS
jgi:hypothetical protein